MQNGAHGAYLYCNQLVDVIKPNMGCYFYVMHMYLVGVVAASDLIVS